jgi:hypothetical protein
VASSVCPLRLFPNCRPANLTKQSLNLRVSGAKVDGLHLEKVLPLTTYQQSSESNFAFQSSYHKWR